MDLKIIILSEVSQRKTNVIHHLHVESKNNKNEFSYKTENRFTDMESKLTVTNGEKVRSDKLGAGN